MSQKPAPRSGIYSIDSNICFVDALADGIWTETAAAPEALSTYTVLLPTRRACRALREAFLRLSGGKPLLLPRMLPLGDVDEDEIILSGGLDGFPGDDDLSIPPAISATRRQLLLCQLVMAFRKDDLSPDQASELAIELGKLLDQVHTEGLDFKDLHKLVPDELSNHWQITLNFLTILSESWPVILKAEGVLDPTQRRNLLLARQAEIWARTPPKGPVIAAGSTGSIPATATLLSVIASLPEGRVILPGLDKDLDDTSWEKLDATHPQFGLKQLLLKLERDRKKVLVWPGKAPASDKSRKALMSEAMRTAATTHHWAMMPRPAARALDGVSKLEAPTPKDEALSIALAMRECLETPGKRAALVTPDRNLARRVTGELRRWHIDVDDSAGCPLRQSAPGTFFMIAADCLVEGVTPVHLLSLLKHPLAAGGMATKDFRQFSRRLEATLLRGPRPDRGFAGLLSALAAREEETGKALDHLKSGLIALQKMAEPLTALLNQKQASLPDLLKSHIAFLEALATTQDTAGRNRLWKGDDGDALSAFIADLHEAARDFPPLAPGRYPALLQSLISSRVVRPKYGRHPRLFIWGNLEARLQQADLIIIGGLNEGTWPPDVKAGPWMSRPMQIDFGLSEPERKIGLAAHDFQQAMGAQEVLLTRSLRIDGSPSLPSRWLLRLENILKPHGGIPRADRYYTWADQLDHPQAIIPWGPPAPKPPLNARPDRLSVTSIETWIRDPYALYAKRVLGLNPLDDIDLDPGAADRGSIIHDALDEFIRTWPDALPDDAPEQLIAIGKKYFTPAFVWPGVRAFWWPRFLRIADWFIEQEKARRQQGYTPLITETAGTLQLDAVTPPFTLTARADRLDASPDGGLAIIDYKTGSPPTAKQVLSGLTPQLSLEGAIARRGGFNGLKAMTPAELTYIRLSGGKEIGKITVIDDNQRDVKKQEKTVPDICNDALTGLSKLVTRFADEETPYLSRPRPQFIGRFNDYDQLARVQEWSVGGHDGDDE